MSPTQQTHPEVYDPARGDGRRAHVPTDDSRATTRTISGRIFVPHGDALVARLLYVPAEMKTWSWRSWPSTRSRNAPERNSHE